MKNITTDILEINGFVQRKNWWHCKMKKRIQQTANGYKIVREIKENDKKNTNK